LKFQLLLKVDENPGISGAHCCKKAPSSKWFSSKAKRFEQKIAAAFTGIAWSWIQK